jgi:pimeloyl-ACP methyl ester carboxylesterase
VTDYVGSLETDTIWSVSTPGETCLPIVYATACDSFVASGVGFTTPHVRIFADATEEAAWALRNEHAPLLNETPSALGRLHAQWDVYGALAADRVRETAEYVSTAFVARDMLAITRAHGFEKIKYWGFSYGSAVGLTFAAMFPDNIERLIVEYVCYAEGWRYRL